jgi:hypothetical protein
MLNFFPIWPNVFLKFANNLLLWDLATLRNLLGPVS